MPIYNVNVVLESVMVVVADDEQGATNRALENYRGNFSDLGTLPDITVLGEVASCGDLRDGWDGKCLPFGGDGNTRIEDLLRHNA